MRLITGLVLLCGLLLGGIKSADCQYIYLDTNGDGINTAADAIKGGQTTYADIWIVTDKNGDGRDVQTSVADNGDLTLNSYEFILRAVGGAVEWGSYTNLMPSMSVHFGPVMNATDYFTFYGGMEILQPGRYKVGRLSLRVKAGNPRIVFASSTPLWGAAGTSFGSKRLGKDGDNTLKFTDHPTDIGSAPEGTPGDWGDSGELRAPYAAVDAEQMSAAVQERFSVSVSPNPANPRAVIQIRTTQPGYLKVRLFSVSGRLVRVIADIASAAPGMHIFETGGHPGERDLPSGVYLYDIQTREQNVSGRLVLMK